MVLRNSLLLAEAAEVIELVIVFSASGGLSLAVGTASRDVLSRLIAA